MGHDRLAEVSEEMSSLARIQEGFLACVQSDPRLPLELALDTAPELKNSLIGSERHRLQVYREGYYLRIASTMSQTLFERASLLAGRELIEGLLLDFLAVRRVSEPTMPAAVGPFPQFCAEHPAATSRPWLPDLLRVGLGRWQVLTGEDPVAVQQSTTPELERVGLVDNHFWLSSAFRLHAIWEAQAETPHLWTGSQGLLILKASATELRFVGIEPPFFGFIEALHQGKNLVEALDEVPDHLASEDVKAEIIRLTAVGVLTQKGDDR